MIENYVQQELSVCVTQSGAGLGDMWSFDIFSALCQTRNAQIHH